MRTTQTDANPWYACYGCGLCTVAYQELAPILDNSTGQQVTNDEGRLLFAEDQDTASAELFAHMDDWHPETDQHDESGNRVREHIGEAPPE